MRIILAYKNYVGAKHVSHIGLGVSALNTCNTLISHQIPCEVWPIIGAEQLDELLEKRDKSNKSPITHVVISALFIPTSSLRALSMKYPSIHFAVNCHSNIGFLQVEPNAIKLLREALDLSMGVSNFSLGVNSAKLQLWIKDAYAQHSVYLPNLYFIDALERYPRPLWSREALRIGVFGALRLQKNLLSAAAAAIELARQLKTPLELYVNSQRVEGGGSTVLQSIQALTRNLPGVSLQESGWLAWPCFRKLVASMHLLISPSYSETFNLVTADGILEGVPSVVGEAIDWVPHYWRANVDDVFDIARVAHGLLLNPHASRDGHKALQTYLHHGIQEWKTYLSSTLKP